MAKSTKSVAQLATTPEGEKVQTPPPGTRRIACAISREQFKAGAKPMQLMVNGIPMAAMVKEFSTGSFGWNLNGKAVIEVNGIPLDVQLGFNLTVIGSKEVP